MATPTVLITGGTGFIGAHTARVLADQGYEVVVADVTTDTLRLDLLGVRNEVEFRRLDLSDPTAVIRLSRDVGATHIIHLGAVTSLIAQTNPRTAIEVNITGTNNILEAARTLTDQIERVAWASTMAVYAPASKYDQTPVDEANLVYPKSIYGATKEFCEHQARLYAEEFDVSVVGLRPTSVYGPFNNPDYLESEGEATSAPRSPSGRLAELFARAAQEKPVSITVPRGAIDWIYVEDVARLFVEAAFTPDADLSRRIYNATRGESATIERAVEIIQELCPDAEIDLTFEGEATYVSQIDGAAAWNDFDISPKYDFRTGIKDYLETIRAIQGLDSIPSES